MYVIKEPLLDEQVVCWNCEEMVHESALQCPYCNVDLRKHAPQKASLSSTPKITPINPYVVAAQNVPQPVQGDQKSGSALSCILSLFLFLGGSAFLFLAMIVFFFSENGSFTISWQQHSASAFLGLGMAAVAFGMLLFQGIDDSSKQ